MIVINDNIHDDNDEDKDENHEVIVLHVIVLRKQKANMKYGIMWSSVVENIQRLKQIQMSQCVRGIFLIMIRSSHTKVRNSEREKFTLVYDV